MTSSNNKHPFKVWITPEVAERLNMYAAEAVVQHGSEIGGFAKIEQINGDVFVTDIFIPDQKATGGTFDVSREMDSEFIHSMIKQGRRKELPLWKSIVHSHPVGMAPSMSGTDIEAIQRRAEETECFSLIITASRTADSTRMFMHWCGDVYGKRMMFSDIPVAIGWESSRLDLANKTTDELAKKLGDLTESDINHLRLQIQNAICSELPPTFENERRALRAQIHNEVKEKVSSPRKHINNPVIKGKNWPKKGSTSLASMNNSTMGSKLRTLIPYAERADMEQAWKTCQRLKAIGYDMMDPEGSIVDYVTDQQAEQARDLYKDSINELNKILRKHAGIGMGDLVLVKTGATQFVRADIEDLLTEPHEVEDFTLTNGVISFEVGGEIFWDHELELMTKYEDVMDWNQELIT